MRVERPGRERVVGVELTGVRDPLVDQDQAGAVALKQLAKRISGTRARAVGVGEERVGFGAAELPGQLAPHGADRDPVGLLLGLAGLELVADEHDPANVRDLVDAQ